MFRLVDAGNKSRRPLRLAIMAAALGVAGCFTAAFAFADEPVQAAQAEPAR